MRRLHLRILVSGMQTITTRIMDFCLWYVRMILPKSLVHGLKELRSYWNWQIHINSIIPINLAAEFFERYIIEKENLSLLPFASQLRHLETAQKIEIINRRNHQLRKEIQEKIQNQAQLEVLATTELFDRVIQPQTFLHIKRNIGVITH